MIDPDLWHKNNKKRGSTVEVESVVSSVDQYKLLCEQQFKDHPSKDEVMEFMLVVFDQGFTDFQKT